MMYFENNHDVYQGLATFTEVDGKTVIEGYKTNQFLKIYLDTTEVGTYNIADENAFYLKNGTSEYYADKNSQSKGFVTIEQQNPLKGTFSVRFKSGIFLYNGRFEDNV